MNFFTSIILENTKKLFINPKSGYCRSVFTNALDGLMFYDSALILEVLFGAHLSKGQTDLKQKGTQRSCFLAQFFMPFHIVWTVLLQVIASKTIKCRKLLIGCCMKNWTRKLFHLDLLRDVGDKRAEFLFFQTERLVHC